MILLEHVCENKFSLQHVFQILKFDGKIVLLPEK